MSQARTRRPGLPVEFAQAPMRTVRTGDAKTVYAHPGSQMARLERLGLLHKVAVGYYIVVPQDRIGTNWRPTIEAAAAGIAAAAVGNEQAVLMGISAARMHKVVPRAFGVAIVAVPTGRRSINLHDRNGEVQFVQRDTTALDAELMVTEIGSCLVTTPEQTVLDLAHRPNLGNAINEASAAIKALLPRCDQAVLDRIAVQQRLVAALKRLRRGQLT